MTTFSINDQFDDLVKAALSEKQKLTEQTDNNIEMTDESAKAEISFKIISCLKENTLLLK